MLMQKRETVTVLSERVCIDLVGPFPTAKGGFRFLLTYINMAMHCQEAIPLKKTTTRIIIDQLLLIFSRNRSPSTFISDNGPQFESDAFKKFLRLRGIQHIKSSSYHPQGNGVVERLHWTLNSVIAKCTEAKGNWAQIVPMALYFVWCLPSTPTGLSPFILKHGWEPATHLQVLYKGWVQQELGPVDLEQWVLENSDRVQRMRVLAVVNMNETSEARKKVWDKGAQMRMVIEFI